MAASIFLEPLHHLISSRFLAPIFARSVKPSGSKEPARQRFGVDVGSESDAIGLDASPCRGWTAKQRVHHALVETYAVNRAVNSIKSDTEDCIGANARADSESHSKSPARKHLAGLPLC